MKTHILRWATNATCGRIRGATLARAERASSKRRDAYRRGSPEGAAVGGRGIKNSARTGAGLARPGAGGAERDSERSAAE